MEFLTLVP
jgi:hypothetical protein